MSGKQKLEPTWVCKDALTKLEQQILLSEDFSLLVYCSVFRVSGEIAGNHYPNLTARKIPSMVLPRCEREHNEDSLTSGVCK